eukprot:CAMPEP_0119044042 /NCGR_PEP_ID=MMETSP1177-20130426/28122_1 /TAXON_ID=2985 /ORGANISM="Ochromonas sp, Strain CCMP1899" /LENGTH=250 /DNA_ID=CAMNT_0007013435 /DNA_START=265 /DNA_END=1017 /DNA_ORIENTATION=+
MTLYVLPPKSPDDTNLTCICATASSNSHDEKGSSSSSLLDQSKTKTIDPSSNSSSSSLSSKPISSKTTVTAPKDDFLSSLLTKMQGTSKLRAAVKIAAPTTILARVEVVAGYDALEKRIREQIEIFDEDPNYMELRLEPMDKDGRYVVHDVITDFPDLVSTAIGDFDERHVIIYRRDHIPEGVDIHQSMQMQRTYIKKKKDISYGKGVSTELLQHGSIAVTKVNPGGDKRDRRSIEEIQQEMKKRRLGNN